MTQHSAHCLLSEVVISCMPAAPSYVGLYGNLSPEPSISEPSNPKHMHEAQQSYSPASGRPSAPLAQTANAAQASQADSSQGNESAAAPLTPSQLTGPQSRLAAIKQRRRARTGKSTIPRSFYPAQVRQLPSQSSLRHCKPAEAQAE